MKKHDWNPEQYLKFDRERRQPSVDLVTKINHTKTRRIADIGCGTGNSTQVLYQKWPKSEIIGIDNSPAMIEKAMKDYPNQKWLIADAGKEELPGRFDVIFSNATIQWIPDHAKLIERFCRHLNIGGILAVQIPLFYQMPLSDAILKVAGQFEWQFSPKNEESHFTIHDSSFYYDCLASHFSAIDFWITDYVHVMPSQLSILEMIRTTGMKPYLERIENEPRKQEFERMVLDEIIQVYPSHKDGKVLFPFRRLFFVAQK